MQTRLIQIIPEETSPDWSQLMHDSLAVTRVVTEGIGEIAKNAGWDKIAESKAGKVFDSFRNAAMTGQKAQGELIVAAGSKTLRSAMSIFKKSTPGLIEIETISQKSAEELLFDKGLKLLPGQVYAQHPLKENVYFSADSLHSEILKEQRAQIIRYFRSAVALRSISIEICSQKTGNFYTASGWGKASGSVSRENALEQRRWFKATYDEPEIEPIANESDLFWMPHFDEIVAATKGVKSGSIETTTTINTSFGIAASAATAANIKGDWLAQQNFVVRAEYG
jgi:hypothetical protein